MSVPQLLYTKNFTPNAMQSVLACDFMQKPLKKEEISKKFDPVILVTEEGYLSQPIAILRYLTAGTPLDGKTPADRRNIQSWFEWFNQQLYPILKELYEQTFGEKEAREDKFDYCLREANKSLDVLNSHLRTRTFFVGDGVTSFDISLAAHLDTLFRIILEEESRKKFTNLVRWFTYVRSTVPFQKHYGRLILCGKEGLRIDKEVKEEVSAEKTEGVKGVKAEGSEKKQRVAEPEDPNGFKLDDFKRQFQNSQYKKDVVQKFLDSFHEYSQKWSLWKVYYDKDVTEGKVDYLTMNLASGNLQRLDGLRKNGFGTWGVYGGEGNYEIRGVMLWKGTEIAEEWKNHPSYMFHKFVQLQARKKQDQEVILDYWINSPQAQGLPLYDSKRLI